MRSQWYSKVKASNLENNYKKRKKLMRVIVMRKKKAKWEVGVVDLSTDKFRECVSSTLDADTQSA